MLKDSFCRYLRPQGILSQNTVLYLARIPGPTNIFEEKKRKTSSILGNECSEEQRSPGRFFNLSTSRGEFVLNLSFRAVTHVPLLECIAEYKMQKMSLAFQQIYQFVEEQRQLLLDQWKSLQTAVKEREVRTATISEEISCLDSLITVAEERWPTPELEFLQVRKLTLFSSGVNERYLTKDVVGE